LKDMALERQVYRCFEDIVGAENISEEPVVLDSYAHHTNAFTLIGRGWWMPRFEAVLLPGNTEEVQAIVRACNRWKIKFKAHSTGNGAFMCPLSEGCVGLDLRRMNRIIEINEKGMYAVIEPSVIGAQLQAELMKRGFATGMIGPGGYTSAFPIASAEGGGHVSTAWGHQHRNLLGLEWVLPDGEILRTGSLGQSGWFGSEGPGPSLRGLACGGACTFGGVGVFTMAATKLYHWPGPPALPVAGVSPSYYLKPQPWFGAWYFNTPSYEKAAEAAHKLGRSEIAIVLERIMAWQLAHNGGRDMSEALRDYQEMQAQEQGKGRVGGFLVIIGADTEREFQYKEKTLRQIIKDVDGELLPFIEENQDYKARLLSRWLRVSDCDRFDVRAGGLGVQGFVLSEDSSDSAMNVAKVSTEVKKEYIKAGLMWDDGADVGHGHFCEQTRACATENLGHVTQTEKGWSIAGDYGQRGVEMRADPENKMCGAPCAPRIGWMAGEKPGEKAPSFLKKPFYNQALWRHELSWVRQIREAIDPNDVAESTLFAGE
jgi:glycolate oxidase